MKRKQEYIMMWEEMYLGKNYCRDPPPPKSPCGEYIDTEAECICECK